MQKKELIINRLNEDVKNWDAQILKLKKKLENITEDKKEKIEGQIENLEEKIIKAKGKIEKIKKKGIKGINETEIPPLRRQ